MILRMSSCKLIIIIIIFKLNIHHILFNLFYLGTNKKRNHLNQRVKRPDYKVAYIQLVSVILLGAGFKRAWHALLKSLFVPVVSSVILIFFIISTEPFKVPFFKTLLIMGAWVRWIVLVEVIKQDKIPSEMGCLGI